MLRRFVVELSERGGDETQKKGKRRESVRERANMDLFSLSSTICNTNNTLHKCSLLCSAVFMGGYMVMAPLFAHLARSVRPTYLMSFGLFMWIFSALATGMYVCVNE